MNATVINVDDLIGKIVPGKRTKEHDWVLATERFNDHVFLGRWWNTKTRSWSKGVRAYNVAYSEPKVRKPEMPA